MPRNVPINYSGIVGRKFSKLKILSIFHIDKYWVAEVICDCGVRKKVRVGNLISGNTKSCGCENISKIIERNTTHGLARHPLFKMWLRMRNRCYQTYHDAYPYYGGRGIIVCDEWESNFKAFYDWAIVNGWKEGLEIDRENTDGMYEPNNCRFVTQAFNKRNRRICVKVEYNGEKIYITDLADKLGMKYKTIKSRYLRGWPIEKIINQPIRGRQLFKL